MNSKVLTLLGFAAKARKLSYGMNATVFSVKQKKARTVLVASDISDKSKKEVNFYCEKFGVNFIALDNYNIESISRAVGKKCGIVSINDESFKESISTAIREEIR